MGKLFSQDENPRQRCMARCLDRLERGQNEALVKTIRESAPASADLGKIVANQAEYFARTAERTRYPTSREQGLLVGAGVVEAGCKP